MPKVIKLTENQFGEMMAYHGSGSDFDKFNHKKYLGKGAGSQTFGWGTYITNDIEIAKSYAESIGKGNYIVTYFNMGFYILCDCSQFCHNFYCFNIFHFLIPIIAVTDFIGVIIKLSPNFIFKSFSAPIYSITFF